MPKNFRIAFLAVAASSLLALVGCGDKSDDKKTNTTPPPLSADLKLKVVGSKSAPEFDKSELKAKAGTVKLTVNNPQGSGAKHGIAIDGGDYKNVEGVAVAPGRQTSLTVTLKPGKYVYYDPAGDFRKEGMEGTLVVKK